VAVLLGGGSEARGRFEERACFLLASLTTERRTEMCNKLHADAVPIKKTGFGWKIVGQSVKGNLSLCLRDVYISDFEGWISWAEPPNDPIPPPPCEDIKGFCFFPTKREAERCLRKWGCSYNKIVRIQYRRGLGRHIERHMILGEKFDIALCKEFKFV
jgi:hypothetical protein